MYPTELLFCDKRKFERLYMALWYETDKKETNYRDFWLIYTLIWVLNDFDAQSDFGKNFVEKIYSLGTFLS